MIKIEDLKLGTPILYRNTTIYLFSFRVDMNGKVQGEYLTEKEWQRYQKFVTIPPQSYEDKTYRTIGQRRNMRPFKLVEIDLKFSTRYKMKYKTC